MHDIDTIRREAMRVLEQEAGGPVAAARKTGMSYAQWANLRSGAPDSKTGKPRGMRKETARKIETSFSKPAGWLDNPEIMDDKELFDALIKAWSVAARHERAVAVAWAQSTLEHHKVAENEETPDD